VIVHGNYFVGVGKVDWDLSIAENSNITKWRGISSTKYSSYIFIEANDFDTSSVLKFIIIDLLNIIKLFSNPSIRFLPRLLIQHIVILILNSFNLIQLLLALNQSLLESSLLHLNRANKNIRPTIQNNNQLLLIQKMNTLTRWHIDFILLRSWQMIVNLQYSSMKHSQVPILQSTAKSKISYLISTSCKWNFVKCLYLM
jgi:hypothetical protein